MYDKRRPIRPFAVYLVDTEYMQYLQSIDHKVVNVVYGKEQVKPFIGPIFEKDGSKFYAPITSPKQKFINKIDVPTIYNLIPETQSKVVGTLLIGNMVPIPDDQLTHINYDHMERYIHSSETKNLGQYGHLIELQLRAANQNSTSIKSQAEKCYELKMERPYAKICDFCNEYEKLMISAKGFPHGNKKKSVRNELADIKSHQNRNYHKPKRRFRNKVLD